MSTAVTGDLRNSIAKLQMELRALAYTGAFDPDSILAGNPTAFLPLIHFVLLDSSDSAVVGGEVSIPQYFASRNHVLYAKRDGRFIDSVYKLLRDEFNYKPVLSRDQFFSNGFAERKMQFVIDVVRMVRNLRVDLGRRAKKEKSPASGKCAAHGQIINNHKRRSSAAESTGYTAVSSSSPATRQNKMTDFRPSASVSAASDAGIAREISFLEDLPYTFKNSGKYVAHRRSNDRNGAASDASYDEWSRMPSGLIVNHDDDAFGDLAAEPPSHVYPNGILDGGGSGAIHANFADASALSLLDEPYIAPPSPAAHPHADTQRLGSSPLRVTDLMEFAGFRGATASPVNDVPNPNQVPCGSLISIASENNCATPRIGMERFSDGSRLGVQRPHSTSQGHSYRRDESVIPSPTLTRSGHGDDGSTKDIINNLMAVVSKLLESHETVKRDVEAVTERLSKVEEKVDFMLSSRDVKPTADDADWRTPVLADSWNVQGSSTPTVTKIPAKVDLTISAANTAHEYPNAREGSACGSPVGSPISLQSSFTPRVISRSTGRLGLAATEVLLPVLSVHVLCLFWLQQRHVSAVEYIRSVEERMLATSEVLKKAKARTMSEAESAVVAVDA
ncbi:Centrosomal protein of 44 kDa [Entophlyctis luteolus]|nr:Centrosomal protein of 44 kDa [Entophlyctis luteolus]